MSDNINFTSAKNYMKRDDISGAYDLAAPVSTTYGGFPFPYITRKVLTHNLGIIPYFEVFYEPFKDGVIWEAMSTRNAGAAINPRNTATDGPYCLAFPTATTITLEIGYYANTLTGTYPVYVIVDRDYGL